MKDESREFRQGKNKTHKTRLKARENEEHDEDKRREKEQKKRGKEATTQDIKEAKSRG